MSGNRACVQDYVEQFRILGNVNLIPEVGYLVIVCVHLAIRCFRVLIFVFE